MQRPPFPQFLSLTAVVAIWAACPVMAEEEPGPAEEIIPFAQPVEETPRPLAEPNFTSTSFSKQFIVNGKDAALCNALSAKADEIRKDLYALLKLPREKQNGWKHSIGIKLFGKHGEPSPEKPIRPTITTLEGDSKMEFVVNIHIGSGIDLEELSKSVTLMLLYEISLRNIDPDALPETIELPAWLTYGIEQALLWKTDKLNRDTYAVLFNREDILHPEEILNQKSPETELDATSFSAYKASCGALVLCLLSQQGGEEAIMRVFDESIFGNDDPKNLIKRNFPLLTLTPTSLHKWWTLQLSSMSTPSATETLSIPETEKRLQEILIIVKYDPETKLSNPVSIDKIEDVYAIPDYGIQLKNVNANLVQLCQRCFPTYAPLIVEYAKIVADLQTKKLKPRLLQKRVDELVEIRQLSLKAAARARDYLDWYEITSKNKISDTFDSYINTMQILREKGEELDTPLSDYLKDVERLYTLPANAPTPKFLPGKNQSTTPQQATGYVTVPSHMNGRKS